MRVALIAEDYYPQVGGIAEHVHHLALELGRMGHAVAVIGSHMAGDNEQDRTRPYAVHRVGRSVMIYANGGISRVTFGLRLRSDLEAVLRAGHFDIVHLHGPLAFSFGFVTPVAAVRTGIPLVGTFHSWFPRSLGYRLLQRECQRRLDMHRAVIAVSEPVAVAHARYFRADWQIIPNGVNTTWYHPNGRDGRRDLRASGPRLLYLHRLEPRNNLGTLIAAMPRILAAYPNAQLVVAGDGPWRSYYERQARRFGDRIRFLGTVADPAECYRAADLYLCPTMRAGFGITLLEAMACGTPVVVADNPGFRYVLDGGRAGMRLPHDDPNAWGDAVVQLLGDPARREAMGKAGVEKAADYAWPVVAQKIVQVYERVTG
ncbi:MAG TPA: glycosyltransferase family 4 protein [Gemmatimonadales bacterium]|nr:glycosyltransferase family 4 protein [Gemmatimonadales bacterium]